MMHSDTAGARSCQPRAAHPERHYLEAELYARVQSDSALFDFLQDGSLDGLWYWDLENPEHEWMSPRFWTTLGYDPGQMPHRADAWQDMIFPEDLALALANFRAHCADPDHPYDQLVRYRRRDGSVAWIRCRGLAIRDASGQPIRMLGAHTDVTELKRAEQRVMLLNSELERRVALRTAEVTSAREQLQAAQRLEAMGHLACGIAHDFNNLLTVMLGYCSLALDGVPAGDPAHEHLREAAQAAERGASLTQQLLAFGSHQVLQPEVLDLNREIRDVEQMLGRVLGAEIAIKTVLHEELGCVECDRGQLSQVLLNLAVNARDAMPQGGELRIHTCPVTRDGQTWAVISVSDDGHGMDAETRARIFEPFFTTKEHTRGTGLGLATTYGIVKQSGGQIQVHSALGVGTTFEIALPVVDRLPAPPPAEVSSREVPRGEEVVLVVEDDPSVRRLTRAVLEQQGYAVLEAGDAREALRQVQANPSIGLLLSDIVMPGMSGVQLAEILARHHPALPVVFMSGYPGTERALRDLSQVADAFVEKPVTPEGLGRTVREVLDRALE